MEAKQGGPPAFLREQGRSLQVPVRVLPRSSRNALTCEADGLRAHLTAPPVDGAANAALIALLAERLHIPKRQVSVVRGATTRQKLLAIEGLSAEEFWRRLSAVMGE
ncbi:MAG TPA: DUF167 domain-containing protein [Ktedonobacterales bacterium]|jgi:hypothetical protein